MARICPDCRVGMTQRTVHEIDVDLCPSCGGLWLDRGELIRLRSLQPDEILGLEAKHPEKLPARSHNPVCPVCGKPIHPFNYAGGKIQLETCDSLDGIWVEAQQLEEIAGLAKPPIEAQLLAQQQEHDSHEHTYHVNRAGDFLKAMDHHYGWPIFWPVPQP